MRRSAGHKPKNGATNWSRSSISLLVHFFSLILELLRSSHKKLFIFPLARRAGFLAVDLAPDKLRRSGILQGTHSLGRIVVILILSPTILLRGGRLQFAVGGNLDEVFVVIHRQGERAVYFETNSNPSCVAIGNQKS